MHLQRDCPSGIRFLAAVKQGHGLKPSARAAGVGKETGYRWLRESFTALRQQGLSVDAAQADLGFHSAVVQNWEAQRAAGTRRHHLAVDAAVEDAFWRSVLGGAGLEAACFLAGMGRSTGYRWWRARFEALRREGVSVRAAARKLRISPVQARTWDAQRRQATVRTGCERDAAERRAVRESARYAEKLMQGRAPRSDVQRRDTQYWQLMRSGLSNTAACKLLGVNRRTGGLIRLRHRHQTVTATVKQPWAGRYLSLPERLQIADLLCWGCRCVRWRPSWVGARPRSNGSWTGTVTVRAATCLAALTTLPATLTGLPKSTQDRLTRLTSIAPQPEPAAAGRRPVNQLTDEEEHHVLTVLNCDRFADKPPAQVYATLLAEGIYLCSISTMYRILAKNAQVKDRRRQASHPPRAVPELQATGPRQVYSWDITKLKGPIRGKYFDCYVMIDIYSRMIVGAHVHHTETAELAVDLMTEVFGVQGVPQVVHADRGTSMTSKSVAMLLDDLEVTRSHSRPRVSNDNPYVRHEVACSEWTRRLEADVMSVV